MLAKALGIGMLLVLGGASWATAASTIDASKEVKEAQETIAAFKKADPELARFFDSAIGHVVFPTVGKGGAGIGGAAGSGVVFEKGKPIGRASLTQVTIGAQLGGQTYSEIIFFETAPAFTDFKKGTLALAAQASAIAAAKGTSANAKYQNGVAVFTIPKGGLMAEASVGGQKFAFEPFGKQ
jgi:lipid-binding SYLF domain-containing protein